MRFTLWLAASACLVLSASAFAAPITYNVDIAFSNVSAVGTITTDGATGAINPGDITAYSLDLTDGATSDTIDQTNSTVAFSGFSGEFSAYPEGLYFDFYGPPAYLLFQDTSTGAYLCLQSDAECNASGDSVVIQTPATDNTGAGESLSNVHPFALGPVPEPSSLLLLGTGVLGTIGTIRRRL